MINANMKIYDYYLLKENEYGASVPADEPTGKIKMSVYITSQGTQDNILYKDCSLVGLTHDTEVNDAYVIEIEKERFKVRYVSPQGRFKQVFMSRVG